MSDEPTEEEQLEAMKERADALGVEYGHNIGLETLTERVDQAIAEITEVPVSGEDDHREMTGAEVLALTGNY